MWPSRPAAERMEDIPRLYTYTRILGIATRVARQFRTHQVSELSWNPRASQKSAPASSVFLCHLYYVNWWSGWDSGAERFQIYLLRTVSSSEKRQRRKRQSFSHYVCVRSMRCWNRDRALAFAYSKMLCTNCSRTQNWLRYTRPNSCILSGMHLPARHRWDQCRPLIISSDLLTSVNMNLPSK